MANDINLMSAEWRFLVFLNYEVEAGLLERHRPDGVELDTYNGRHYASVAGLMFLDTEIAGIPDPLHQEFEQVNLRFYVRRPLAAGGYHRGVVFVREIVPDALPAVAARALYNERYVQMPMRHDIVVPGDGPQAIGTFEYGIGTQGDVWHRIHAATHGPVRNVQMGSKEEYLTMRPWGYSGTKGMTTLEYHVVHPQWRIWPTTHARMEIDVKEIFGREFEPYLNRAPDFGFVAEGSPVVVHLPHGLDEIVRREKEQASRARTGSAPRGEGPGH